MRLTVFFVMMACLATARAQQGGTESLNVRYGFEVNESTYPQKTPAETLKSVIKAIQEERISYLLAQLADPEFVDKKVAEYKNLFRGKEEGRALLAFDRLVKETGQYFQKDPMLLRELKRFAKEGEWKGTDTGAAASVKDLPEQQVFMRKLQNRWFLENKQK